MVHCRFLLNKGLGVAARL